MKNNESHSNNPYLDEVITALPRVLALFDADKTNTSFGMGDRYFWAWGLIDFGNATYQGAAHGFARLWTSGLWPYPTTPHKFHERIHSIFTATKTLTQKDGSLEEAFPNEGSYCVTALVAFDLLCTIELLESEVTGEMHEQWKSIIAPLITYLISFNETHAVISNHLATASAALLRWHKMTSDDKSQQKAILLLERIRKYQSVEGWLKEYDGPDPGYQSFCTYYLADVHQQRPDLLPLESLESSVQFLWHFAHPDGSFGGMYGSRCTRFYCPAGMELLADTIPEAGALASFMRKSVCRGRVVTLSTMDDSNLVPMFNAYCYSATLCNAEREESEMVLPSCRTKQDRTAFPHCGIFIDQDRDFYTIISTSKGGVVYHYVDGEQRIIDGGVVVQKNNVIGSTQMWNEENNVTELDNGIVVESEFRVMPKHLPTPLQFLILRMFCVTVFLISPLREWVKKQLVKRLITSSKSMKATNTRTITLGKNLTITDTQKTPSNMEVLKTVDTFVPIHMASQGYWQFQDEQQGESNL